MSYNYVVTEDPIVTQITLLAQPPAPPSKPIDYCADVKYNKKFDKKGKLISCREKPGYVPEKLSTDLYTLTQLFANFCLYPVHPTVYMAGAVIGFTKPLLDYHFSNVLPKKLPSDNNEGDFAKLNNSDRARYVGVALVAPAAIAMLTKTIFPPLSYAIVGLGSLALYHQFSQRLVRWIAPS